MRAFHRIAIRTALSLLAALCTLEGCSGAVGPADGSNRTDASDVVLAETGIDQTGCPQNPSAAANTPCSNDGQTCSNCQDPCQFCNILRCTGGHWTPEEVFPTDCNGGDVPPVDARLADASGVACGDRTCAPGQVCVRTESSGGPCQPVPDGGVCPPNTVPNGPCCIAYGVTYACADRPAGCDPLSCGCAGTLCGAGPGGCPCVNATATQLECACRFP
jgi:hypothetical protein